MCGCKVGNHLYIQELSLSPAITTLAAVGQVDDADLQRFAGGFDKAVKSVFTERRKQYPELETRLRKNAARIGAYKTYDLQQRIANLPNNEQKPQKEKMLRHIYNGYQAVEYKTIVSRARTAKQWVEFESETELYPNIEWLATMSAVPRLEHAKYTGLILPANDPFWDHNQPGNEWNCKCDWRTTDKPAAASAPATQYKPSRGLEGNPAKTGELFSEKHPYFARNADAPKWVERKAMLWMPDEVGFKEVKTKWGTYKEHLLVAKEHEAKGNREIATDLVKAGYKDVALLPQIYKDDKVLRERYYGKDYVNKTKCPDAKFVDKNKQIIADFKTVESYKQLISRLNKGATQANGCVIKMKYDNKQSYRTISRRIDQALKALSNIQDVILLDNRGYIFYEWHKKQEK